MQNSKLINILKSFSREEMRQFEKFVSSPYFNTVKNNEKLLTELKRFYPKFDNQKLTYEYLFGKIYPGKKFNKQMMWNLVSAMEKLAEEFITQLALKYDEFGKMRYAASYYQHRDLRNNLGAMLRIMDKFTKTQIGDIDYFYYLSELERLSKEYHHIEDKQYLLCENVLKYGEYQVLLFLKMMSYTISDLYANSLMYNANYEFNTPRVNKEFQKDQRSLSLAMLNISLKNYELALQNLNQVDFMDVKDKLLLKVMMVQIYYEMRDTETMMYHIDSAKHFLSKNKFVSEIRRNSYMNFYNFMIKLTSLRENGDKSPLASLIDKVKNTGELSEKAWLLEKLEELK